MHRMRTAQLLLVTMGAMLSESLPAGHAETTHVTVCLVRSDQSHKTVETAQRGNLTAYSRYPRTAHDLGVRSQRGRQALFRRAGYQRPIEASRRDARPRFAGRRTPHRTRRAQVPHQPRRRGRTLPRDPSTGQAHQFAPSSCALHRRGGRGREVPVWARLRWRGRDIWSSPPAVYATPLTLYLPATGPSGYETNLSDGLLQVTAEGVRRISATGGPLTKGDASPSGFTVQVPIWRLTSVLLLDQPAKALAHSFAGREEATQASAFEARMGNWDPRTRIASHATLPASRAGWHFHTGVHEWLLAGEEQAQLPPSRLPHRSSGLSRAGWQEQGAPCCTSPCPRMSSRPAAR